MKALIKKIYASAVCRNESNIMALLEKKPKAKVLDIGVGTGRVMKILSLITGPEAKIYGLDISSKMAAICRKKFSQERKIRKIFVMDVTNGENPAKFKFDMVTAVRILKYSRKWRETINKIGEWVKPGGIFIFSMPNVFSLNCLARFRFELYRSCESEVRGLLDRSGWQVREVRGFSRIPDIFYIRVGNRKIYARILDQLERLMDRVFGLVLFQRCLFFVAERK